MEMQTDETNRKQKITELGIDIYDFTCDSPETKTKCYDYKQKIFREFTLATLATLIKSRFGLKGNENSTAQVSALDALACTGVAGIQWKKHFSKNVHVTLSKHEDISLLKNNAQNNSLSCTEVELNPKQIPGEPFGQQGENEVHINQADVRAVLAMESYNFIYLSPYKKCAVYFESALQSLRCGGLLCLVVTDVSMFARSPHVVKRCYGADFVKTEYMKEMSARVILASLAQAAARFSKGISSQYVLSQGDSLLICIKTSRGHVAADLSLSEVASLLHCRFCEERAFIPNQLAPHDDPYSLLACNCKKNNPGKTAVVLGPMWKGPLNDPELIKHMQKESKHLPLSSRCFELFQLLVTESTCAKSDKPQTEPRSDHEPVILATEEQNNSNIRAEKESLMGLSTHAECSDKITDPLTITGDTQNSDNKQGISLSSQQSMTFSNPLEHRSEESIDKVTKEGDDSTGGGENDLMDSNSRKRKASEVSGIAESLTDSKCRRNENGHFTTSACVPFYQRVNKFKRTHIPKLDKLVTILHSCGHRASRTHFDPSAVRTSATVDEFLHVLG